MVTSTVRVTDRFPEITADVERLARRALNDAAEAAARAADEAANSPRAVARFAVVPAHGVGDGFASGVHASPLARIFDKGSLGKHVGTVKRARKPSWEVNRGSNPYTAHRRSLAGGVAPRRIFAAARKAGRAVLASRLTGH